MAKKKGTEKPKPEMTRRQLTRWQKEKRRNRLILSIGILVIVAVILTVGVGWYTNEFRPLHETVITVNERTFDMGYFITMLKAYGQGQTADYMYSLAGQLTIIIERNELIREGAEKLGITVSEEAVDNELAQTGQSGDFRDMVRTDLIVQKLLSEYFGPQIPTSAEQRQIMAMFLGSRSQADEIAARIDKGEDFAALAKEFSLESVTKESSGDLGWHPKEIFADKLGTSIVGDYGFGAGKGVLSPPIRDEDSYKNLGFWLIRVLERNDDTKEVHVQAILLGSAEEAQTVRARLESGEDFAAVAKEVSQYGKESGGDLGWLPPDSVTKAFSDFAFNASTELGKVSEPIRDEQVTTTGGYWLVKVVDIQTDQKLSDEDMSALKNKALNDWIASMFAAPENHIDHSPLTSEKIIFAVSRAAGA